MTMQRNSVEAVRPERPARTTVEGDGPPTGSTGPGAGLPLDVVFGLLSNERRRRVVRYLLDRAESEPESDTESTPATLGELAEHIAAIENDKPEKALSSAERKRVYICLYQCHLPKMDDAGVVDFDDQRKSVAIASGIDHLRPYLVEDDPSPGTERPRPGHYLGLSFLGMGTFALQTVVFPAAWLSGIILGALLAVVGLVAFEHLRRSDRLP